MAAATQPQHPPPPSSSSADEEALKRNTDCVYFLASPLTCKKGSECEYRHSEYARVNPRDCYFWLNASDNKVDLNNNKASKDSVAGSQNNAVVVDKPSDLSSALKEGSIQVLKNDEKFKSATAVAVGKAGESIKRDQGPQLANTSELEIEDGMIVEHGVENQEYEGDDQREEDYVYEQVDEGDYNNEEGENVDAEEEYVDDEDDGDEDDFAKKIGVMFS
ncbi:hypothetical protein Tsubulata_050797 [Turnera subulata]|uniref:C3H1-type domain-containing protein n=1 Tax=Turnera subulata TaxID=218843 RepID=A0A9Q0GE33_9ROSI|nr:hypothetical protein Tsubulata_050797 [Turnera subulata]